ncbi:MAG: YdeI/OmpD-associated family protein [Propionicimonas sp.]
MSRGRDEVSMLQRYTPRRSRSTWSARNVALVGELITQGRMRPRGQAEIDRAKADGRWEAAYQGSRTMPVPADLATALAANPAAAAGFERLSSQNRYAILFRLHQLKTAEARARNVVRYIAMLEAGQTVHPQPPTHP